MMALCRHSWMDQSEGGAVERPGTWPAAVWPSCPLETCNSTKIARRPVRRENPDGRIGSPREGLVGRSPDAGHRGIGRPATVSSSMVGNARGAAPRMASFRCSTRLSIAESIDRTRCRRCGVRAAEIRTDTFLTRHQVPALRSARDAGRAPRSDEPMRPRDRQRRRQPRRPPLSAPPAEGLEPRIALTPKSASASRATAASAISPIWTDLHNLAGAWKPISGSTTSP